MKKALLLIAVAACALVLLSGCTNTSDGNNSGNNNNNNNSQSETYNAGTYTAIAQGYGGDLSVEVKFDSTSILSVDVTSHKETEGVGDQAVEALPGKIVEAQRYDVDVVSSATVTSNAIKDAVKDCVEQATRK